MSLLFDEDMCVLYPQSSESSNIWAIMTKIEELKVELSVSEDMTRQIELEIKGQRKRNKWFVIRRLAHSIIFWPR